MAENCSYYLQGKCTLAPVDSQFDCNWSFPAYDKCKVYLMNAAAAGGGSMQEQHHSMGAPAHGAAVSGVRTALSSEFTPVSLRPAGGPISASEKTKSCPTCSKEIKAAEETCPTCGAKFEVHTRAYCSHCHKLIHSSKDEKCPDCQGSDLLDPRLFSSLIAAGRRPGESSGGASPLEGTATPADTKQCPVCAESIKAEARLCRYCRARFEVTVKGYCVNCHAEAAPVENDRCPRCGGGIIDRHIVSTLLSGPTDLAAPTFTASGVSAAGALAGTIPPVPKAQPTAAAISSPVITTAVTRPQGKVHMPLWQLYLSPRGRIGRLAYFLKGILPLNILMVVIGLSAQDSFGAKNISDASAAVSVALGIGSLLYLWAWLMLMIKRLHDLGRPGWDMLMWLIPLVGQFIYIGNLFEFIFRRGEGPNKYGEQAD